MSSKKLLARRANFVAKKKDPKRSFKLRKFSLAQLLKLTKHTARVSLVVLVLAFLMGYHPVWAIPPIKKSEVLAQVNSQEEVITKASFSEAFKLPHPGYMSTKFSSWHPGVDIATGLGMPIRPIMKGKVVDVQYTFWGLGHFVTIEHEQGYRSTYAHMGRIYVKNGDEVDQNSIIGDVGLTGWTSGAHTHLEVSKDGKNIDPENILPSIPSWEEYAKEQENLAKN